MKNTNDPFFIVGCGRSGTTLLRVMLSCHRRIMIPPECDFLWRTLKQFGPRERVNAQKIDKLLNLISKISSFPEIGLSLNTLREEFNREEKRRIKDCLTIMYQMYAMQHGKERWGDKNPFHVLYLDLIKNCYPKAKIIHIIRDGRDVVLSYRKIGKKPPTLFQLAMRWMRCVEAGIEWGLRFPQDYFELRYEDLIEKPEQELKRICEFLVEDYEPEMLNYYQNVRGFSMVRMGNQGHHYNLSNPVMSSNKEKWKKMMGATENSHFTEIAGTLLQQLGYQTNGHYGRLLKQRLFMTNCRIRYAAGSKRPIQKAVDKLPWRLRKIARFALLIDPNGHYR